MQILDCQIAKPNSLLKLPKVEKCIFRNIPEYNVTNNLIFDFTSFNNLKEFDSDDLDFFYLELYNSLNKVRIEESPNFTNSEFKKKIIEKLLLAKSLNYIYIYLSNLDINDISQFKEQNTSVENLHVSWGKENSNFNLYHLQNIFPNTTDFFFDFYIPEIKNTKISIVNSLNYKIKHLTLNECTGEIIVYCNYQLLESLSINSSYDINFLTFFENNEIMIKSLKTFSIGEFLTPIISKDSLDKIYHSFDRMTNLNYIILHCKCEDIDIEIYNKFIIKLLHLKLDYLDLYIIKNDDYKSDLERYSIEELKNISPEINCNDLDKINIYKI